MNVRVGVAAAHTATKLLLKAPMTDRRLHPRSLFLAPASAQLRVTADAQIESWRGTRAVVISSCPSTCGDELLVQVMADNGDMVRWAATVTACEPIVGRRPARYRVILSLTPAHSPAHAEGVPVE
jgi:hypothetical protein